MDGPPIIERARKTGCLVEGCTRGHHCQGYCKPHYSRLQKTGTVSEAGIRVRHRTTWTEDDSQATCWSCGETKPADDFYMQSTGSRQGRCKECTKTAMQTWRQENAEVFLERQKWYSMRFNFGIEREQYEALLAAQGGGCGICGTRPEQEKRRLHVDHDHETGAVRGILCGFCNTATGLFGEDMRLMNRAATYLEQGAA